MSRITMKDLMEAIQTTNNNINGIRDEVSALSKRVSALEKQPKAETRKETKKSSPKKSTTSGRGGRKATSDVNPSKKVNIDDYTPSNWDEYTENRKKYSYAVCIEEKGVKYDAETYKKASAFFRGSFYEDLK